MQNKKHPAQIIQELQKLYAQEQMTMQSVASLYGSGLAMQLTNERILFGQPQRLQTPSSYIHLEVAMNKLTDIDYCDYMNQPQYEL
ncbi:hypothetical protein pb186bvf_012657 [Paramecium bursaria]